MRLRHAFSALLPLVLTACGSDGPSAGTGDEVTTSLQILADNVRSIPMASSEATVAARGAAYSAGSASDTIWSYLWMEDHRTWSGWRMYSKEACVPDNGDSSLRRCVERFDQNDSEGFAQGVETYRKDLRGTASLDFRCDIVARSGFVWNTTQTLILKRSGDWSQGVRRTGRFVFPGPGWYCPFDLDDSEDSKEFTRALASGLPLYDGNRQIGRMVVDSTTGIAQAPRIRWFDMAGREYLAQPLRFRNNAGDSVGLRVIQTRRDTLDGLPGIAIDGRFHIPERYGMFPDSVNIFARASGGASEHSYGSVPAPVGRFTLFLPRSSFELPDSGLFHLSFQMRGRNPSVAVPAIPTDELPIP